MKYSPSVRHGRLHSASEATPFGAVSGLRRNGAAREIIDAVAGGGDRSRMQIKLAIRLRLSMLHRVMVSQVALSQRRLIILALRQRTLPTNRACIGCVLAGKASTD